ncbi:MAG: hypothetical protein KAS87_03950, partial [Candidatus Omnitrophica bacterium]|nr:hypothetical protein [Candidatus Omnitrophota bacterium]
MKKLVFLLIFISINIVFVEAQEWKIAKGIKDTNLKAIAADKENSDVIYIGSRFIYKTENSGEDWQKVWTLPAMAKVNFLLAEGKTVYAATEKGLFKSDDDGENWQRIFREIDEENNILCLDWDRQNNLLYIGTQDGLFRNRDNGNWQKSKGKLGNAEIYGIKISPENADAIYVISNEGFFKTDNRGKNWKRTFIISKIAEEEEQEETNQQMNRLNDLVIAQKAIYLTGRDILLKSEDKGETWQEMSKEVLEGADIRSIVVFGNRIFLGTDRGVFKRRVKGIGKRVKGEEIEKKEQEGEEENGEGWEEIYVGLSSLDIQKVILAGDDLWAITGKGLFKLQVAGYRLQVKDEEENKILEEKDKEVNIEQQIF